MILVTGSAGYIGSHLIKKLHLNNVKFLGIDNLSYSKKENIYNKQKFIKTDIGNIKKIKEIILKYNINQIIHCAASSYVLEGEKYKKKYTYNNVIKTKKFIETCFKMKVNNFIFLSSSNVYKENKNRKPFFENSKVKPKNTYGQNKLKIEKYLLKKKFKNLIILRLFNIIGINKKFTVFKFKKENYQRLIFKIVQNIKKNKKINLNIIKKKNKILYPSRDFLDINDLTNLIYKIIIKIKKTNIKNIFNVGSGKTSQINLIYSIISKKLKKINRVKLNELNNSEIYITLANINKVSKFFSWKPNNSLKKSIESHLKY